MNWCPICGKKLDDCRCMDVVEPARGPLVGRAGVPTLAGVRAVLAAPDEGMALRLWREATKEVRRG